MLSVKIYLLVCWMSLCWVSLCWVSWRQKHAIDKRSSLFRFAVGDGGGEFYNGVARLWSGKPKPFKAMEQHALKNGNNCLNTNIYSYLETSCCGQVAKALAYNNMATMEQHSLKNENNCLNTYIYSYLEASCCGQSSNLYVNVVNFFIISNN